jgi:hypothetical protein
LFSLSAAGQVHFGEATATIIISSTLHILDYFYVTAKPRVTCSGNENICKNCLAHFCSKEKLPIEDAEANVEVSKESQRIR